MISITGTFDAIIKMIRYEGLPGFYKGMSTKIVQSVFAASVLFMVKEELVKAYLVLVDKSWKVLQEMISLAQKWKLSDYLPISCIKFYPPIVLSNLFCLMMLDII